MLVNIGNIQSCEEFLCVYLSKTVVNYSREAKSQCIKIMLLPLSPLKALHLLRSESFSQEVSKTQRGLEKESAICRLDYQVLKQPTWMAVIEQSPFLSTQIFIFKKA